MSGKRSSSESDVSESSATVNADEVKALVSITNNRCSKPKDTKKFVQRCKSNPERSWRKQSETCRRQTFEQQPITDQPQKLSYFSYLGRNSARMVRYHSLSTEAEVVINLGHEILAANKSQHNAFPEAKEMHRQTGIACGEPIKTHKHLDCLTCMCCVKALFYHSTKDCEFERNWGDEPCSCEVPGKMCVARWSILGILSVFMPCLVCYPICKGC